MDRVGKITSEMSENITDCDGSRCIDCLYYGICSKIDDAEYRTNGKKVRVRYKVDNDKYIVGESTCHKSDTFDLIKRLKVAYGRLSIKLAKYHLESIIKEIG